MEVKANLQLGISKKNGKPYAYVDIKITDTYTKRVFLDNAEVEIVQLIKG